MVTMVSILTVFFAYLQFARVAKADIENKADELVVNLAGILDEPLWDMDEQTVNRIGRTLASDGVVADLRISNGGGVVCFDYSSAIREPLVRRSRPVLHDGHTTGLVEIALTQAPVIASSRRMLLSSIGLMALVILVLGLSTGLILRAMLTKWVEGLCRAVNAYAAGRYDERELEVSALEFSPLVRVLSGMGATITAQMLELRQAEHKYRSIVENAVEGIFQITEEGNLLSANPAMARILGYDSAGELLAKVSTAEDSLYVVPAQREELIGGMLDGRTVSGFYLQLHRKDGCVVHSSIHARPVFDEEGSFVCVEGTLEDITERRRAEVEKAQLEAQLRQSQKMEAVGTLAGGIAHDFNNILTPIMGYAQMTMLQVHEGHPIYQDMQELLKAAERARDLIRQILVIGCKENGAPMAPVLLGPLVQDVAKFLRSSLLAAIRIETQIDPQCGPVLGNASLLHQVLLNLCTNAAYAMEVQGGVLTIALAHGSGGNLEGRWVRLAVSDTGTGIEPEVLRHIFEPYFTTKPTGKGSGLGLAVVHGIVSKLGGEIRVQSEKGKGSSFEVLLPETDRVSAPLLVADAAPRGNGQRILIVDDEAAVRKVLKGLLEALGYRVWDCAGGGEALQLFRAAPQAFDAVLTDFSMPGMSGLDLAASIHRVRPQLPVILGTGYAEAISRENLADYGLQGVFSKPYSMHGLAEALNRALKPAGSPVFPESQTPLRK